MGGIVRATCQLIRSNVNPPFYPCEPKKMGLGPFLSKAYKSPRYIFSLPRVMGKPCKIKIMMHNSILINYYVPLFLSSQLFLRIIINYNLLIIT